MEFWSLIYYIDITLFIFVSATVLYLAVFAFASLFSKHTDIPRAKTLNRFVILIPVYKNGIGAEHTVRAALGQSYPQRLFDITVISDHIDELSNFRLAQQPIRHCDHSQCRKHCGTRFPGEDE